MVKKDSRKGTIRFSFKPMYPVSDCQVAGDFNNWQPVQMVKTRTGQFAVEVKLPPGTHQYKFILDGQWMADPDNNTYVSNAYGTVNSVLQVEETKKVAARKTASKRSRA